MEYVTIPGTELEVSRVCLGTMQFAGSVEEGTYDVTWGAIDQDTVNATVQVRERLLRTNRRSVVCFCASPTKCRNNIYSLLNE